MKQSFQEIMQVANDFKAELDMRNKHKNKSPLTQKYINRLLYIAAQRGEKWAMRGKDND